MDALRRLQAGWGYPTVLLCVYGFFSTIKPLEPFLIPYLTGPDKNLTTEQVANQIFPVWTYSYLVILLPVFLLTDYLRYKPVIVFQCANLLATTVMLLWAEGVAAMQAMQFLYGMVTATEVAYFSYIYSVVDLQHYRKATSYCRSVQLLGYTLGAVLGQALVSSSLMSYHNILIMTLVMTCVALATSLFLPMPQRSVFFHRQDSRAAATQPSAASTPPNTLEEEEEKGAGGSGPPETAKGAAEVPLQKSAKGCLRVVRHLWRDCRQCYSGSLLCWSVWWALATCGYNQTVNYVQVLWEHVQPSQNFTIYNGGVEALSNLFGAASASAVGFVQVNWAAWGELALGSCSALGAAALFLMTFMGSIWVCYAGYVIFKSLYMLLITIAMFQIAAELSMERYALIFGVNTFGALVLQTVLTAVVVDSRGLGLDIVPQFTIYGSYFSTIAAIFLLRGLYGQVKRCRGHAHSSPEGEAA
ncbi:thiamine transporter 1 [Anguilla anguilla]|uniref:thiamine transporter 1 n=1 Tax=Anguilla anguilla TaxID=7936 RepID=UPI0015A97A4D|nr:thiamine transporter 1 [Anguilla anguilla]